MGKSLRSPRIAGVEVLNDVRTDKHYRFDQRTGECSLCDMNGEPVPRFHQDTTGVVDKEVRKERDLFPKNFLTCKEMDLPDYVGIPEKWVGYQQMPRPEIEMDVNADYSFRIRNYLQPKPPKIGKVSTIEKKPPVPKLKWKGNRPSFKKTLETQFAPTVKVTKFLEIMHDSLGDWNGVNTLTATNKQLLLDAQPDPMEALRAQRSVTKGRFGTKNPPFNNLQIASREKQRDKQINPTKYKKASIAHKLDMEAVEQRRRNRYMQHFIQKEEEEQLRQAQMQAVTC